MNIDLVIAAGYDTADSLANFLMLDFEEQEEIYRAIVGKLQKQSCACGLTTTATAPGRAGNAPNPESKQ